MAPPGWHAIRPTGLARSILAVAITFSILCTIIIILRVTVRLRLRKFATEDWLMCIGYVYAPRRLELWWKSLTFYKVINMVHNAVISYGTFTGLGSPDERIPGGATGVIWMEGAKVTFSLTCPNS